MKKENQNSSKPLILIAPIAPTSTVDAARTAGIAPIPASIGLFASGEPFVELFPKSGDDFAKHLDAIKGRDVIVVQSGGEPVGEATAHLLMAVHTLKSYGAAHVTAVICGKIARSTDGLYRSVPASLPTNSNPPARMPPSP